MPPTASKILVLPRALTSTPHCPANQSSSEASLAICNKSQAPSFLSSSSYSPPSSPSPTPISSSAPSICICISIKSLPQPLYSALQRQQNTGTMTGVMEALKHKASVAPLPTVRPVSSNISLTGLVRYPCSLELRLTQCRWYQVTHLSTRKLVMLATALSGQPSPHHP